MSHGVTAKTARSLNGRIEPGNALLTLNPKDKDPGKAITIVKQHGGRVGDAASGSWGSWSSAAGSGDSASLVDEDFEESVFLYR